MEFTKDIQELNPPGQFLKKVREKQQLKCEDIANKLHLKVSVVQALEHGEYEKIGGMVYIKGYLRAYAKLLQVDIEPFLTTLVEETQKIMPKQNVDGSYSSFQVLSSAPPKKKMVYSVIFFIILLVIIFAALVHYHGSTKLNAADHSDTSTMETNVPPIEANSPTVMTITPVIKDETKLPALAATSAAPVPPAAPPKVMPAPAGVAQLATPVGGAAAPTPMPKPDAPQLAQITPVKSEQALHLPIIQTAPVSDGQAAEKTTAPVANQNDTASEESSANQEAATNTDQTTTNDE